MLNLKSINPTAAIVTLLTIAFIWAQWPTRVKTDLPDSWHDLDLGNASIRFEQSPESETMTADGQTLELFVNSRKGLDFMIQVIKPATDNPEDWLKASQKIDQAGFNGTLELDWQFSRGDMTVHEYVLSNQSRYVNQVRVIFTPEAIYKMAVAFKQSDNPELMTRVLGYLDSFTLK